MSGDLSTDINPLEIGCVDEETSAEPHKLLSHLFPSKIGGKPAWLALDGLPSYEIDLHCNNCSGRLTFLMQVYCPVEASLSALNPSDSDEIDTFHRCLFFFMCPNGGCYGNEDKSSTPRAPIKVFRSQLARKNPYYPFEPPNYEASWSETVKLIDSKKLSHPSLWQPICALCGCPANGNQAVRLQDHVGGAFCCPEHRDALRLDKDSKIDAEFLLRLWTSSSTNQSSGAAQIGCQSVLPEFGLLIGPDPGYHGDDKDDDEAMADEDGESSASSDDPAVSDVETVSDGGAGDRQLGAQERQSSPTPMDDYDGEKNCRGQRAGESDEVNRSFNEFVDGIEKLAAKETPALKRLADFKRATRREPGQVFRYQRHGIPLLISDQSVAPAPNCEHCGSERQFECQITPQLLSWLPLNESPDSVGPDFGSVLVYTCSRSCPAAGKGKSGGNYVEEFVAMQYV